MSDPKHKFTSMLTEAGKNTPPQVHTVMLVLQCAAWCLQGKEH